MNKKHIIAIDFVLVVGTLLVVAMLVGYSTPLVISPLDGFKTTNTAVLFEFEKAEAIILDDNLEFTSPEKIYVENNLVINLKPGKYYWKILGITDSEVRELTIQSEVDLKIRESESRESYELVNSGNTPLNVDIYNNGNITGKIVLGVDESEEVSGTKFIGRGNDI